jgi:hypothetical protein
MRWPARWTEGVVLGVLVELLKAWWLGGLAGIFAGVIAWLTALPPLMIVLITVGTFALTLCVINEVALLRSRLRAKP